jgi:CheY-like chemotaxis protein
MAVVLIADDDVDINNVLRHVFVRAGFTVLVAFNGLQALAMAVSAIPDAVLSDLDMPGMDGWQLCAAVRAEPVTAQIPLALLSGSLQYGDPRVVTAKACRGWTKPFANSALVDGIRDLIAAGRHDHGEVPACRSALAAV